MVVSNIDWVPLHIFARGPGIVYCIIPEHIHIPTGLLEILKGSRGSQKAKTTKWKYEAKFEFPEGFIGERFKPKNPLWGRYMYGYFLQQHIVKLTAKLIFVHTRGIVAYPEDLSPSSSSVILLAKAWRYPLASFSSLTLQEENDIFTTKFIPKQSSESKWALYDKTFVMSIQDGGIACRLLCRFAPKRGGHFVGTNCLNVVFTGSN